MDTVEVSLAIPADLAERYGRLAQSTGRSVSGHMAEALADSIDRLEYECGIIGKVEDFRAGKLETATLDEVVEALGLG